MELFITCGPGLEALVEEELKELGYSSQRRGFRGVYVSISSLSDIYRLNYALRIATRVLLPILSFRCALPEDLYQSILAHEWMPYFRSAKTLAIDANVDHPVIKNSLYAAQLVKDAICDQFVNKNLPRPSVDLKMPDLQLNLFLRQNKGVLSLDTSGMPLHKRGYRVDGGEAPLRETLAAGLLRLARYTRDDILIDPCAGSGTFLIEAALLASQTPPGSFRKQWGFFNLPQYDEKEWLQVKIDLDAKRRSITKGFFYGIELNRNVHRLCLNNIRAAGMHPYIQVQQGDFRAGELPILPTFLITNPPYGRRMEEENMLASTYRSLGDFMKHRMAKPGRAFVLTGSLPLSKEVGLATTKRHVIDHGGVESRFLEFEIY